MPFNQHIDIVNKSFYCVVLLGAYNWNTHNKSGKKLFISVSRIQYFPIQLRALNRKIEMCIVRMRTIVYTLILFIKLQFNCRIPISKWKSHICKSIGILMLSSAAIVYISMWFCVHRFCIFVHKWKHTFIARWLCERIIRFIWMGYITHGTRI